MKTFIIRGIDTSLAQEIKMLAQKENLSVNQWVLSALKKITGRNKEPVFKTYHDLDALAGGWSREETETFNKNTSHFEHPDEELWN